MSTPEIAVIVPVYNGAKYLPACVDSITAQSFTDFLCVLVDDGSPTKPPPCAMISPPVTAALP